MKKSIRFQLNGKPTTLDTDEDRTLLWVLRTDLGLTGAKHGCGVGVCGSCTVILDGRAVLSCMTLAIECGGRKIETVEEVARTNPLLIEKYAEHHAMQCGYCTPGFVVAAKALLSRNPSPTEDQIKEALAGNLCRCGTYPQHSKAVLEAAERP